MYVSSSFSVSPAIIIMACCMDLKKSINQSINPSTSACPKPFIERRTQHGQHATAHQPEAEPPSPTRQRRLLRPDKHPATARNTRDRLPDRVCGPDNNSHMVVPPSFIPLPDRPDVSSRIWVCGCFFGGGVFLFSFCEEASSGCDVSEWQRDAPASTEGVVGTKPQSATSGVCVEGVGEGGGRGGLRGWQRCIGVTRWLSGWSVRFEIQTAEV